MTIKHRNKLLPDSDYGPTPGEYRFFECYDCGNRLPVAEMCIDTITILKVSYERELCLMCYRNSILKKILNKRK